MNERAETDVAAALADRLERAITTAQNDDLSKVGTEERLRHTDRAETMRDVVEFLRATPPAAPAGPDADMFSRINSARYPDPSGTAENAWNDALEHLEEGLNTHPLAAPAGGESEAVAWLVLSEETGNTRIWWRDKARAEEWSRQHNKPLIPLYADPRVGPILPLAATPAQSNGAAPDFEASVKRIMRIRNGMTPDPEAKAIVREELSAAARATPAMAQSDEGQSLLAAEIEDCLKAGKDPLLSPGDWRNVLAGLRRCSAGMAQNTCYVERSKVRAIIVGEPFGNLNVAAEILRAVDALPIVTADDIPAPAQPKLDRQQIAKVIYATWFDADFITENHFAWFDAGKNNPESCVHYSNVAKAFKVADRILTISSTDRTGELVYCTKDGSDFCNAVSDKARCSPCPAFPSHQGKTP